MPPSAYYFDVIRGNNRSPLAAITRAALTTAAGAYRIGIAARNASFQSGIRSANDLGRPTLSVGNLTVGGTGKTPMVIELARRLHTAGAKPAVLLRGYKSDQFGSDEAALLTQYLGDNTPIQTGASRIDSARKVIARHPDTSVFILDDGFQHRQAKRDLDIVLIDATHPFGFGHILPRGLLREPISSLKRADAVILTRTDQANITKIIKLDQTIQDSTGYPPIAHASYVWSGYINQWGDQVNIQSLRNAAVIGVCGIGNPTGFEQSLRQHADQVPAFHAMSDHHHYTLPALQQIQTLAHKTNAAAIVTTEKDWVKWHPLLQDSPPKIPIFRPIVTTKFTKGDQEIDNLLTRLI